MTQSHQPGLVYPISVLFRYSNANIARAIPGIPPDICPILVLPGRRNHHSLSDLTHLLGVMYGVFKLLKALSSEIIAVCQTLLLGSGRNTKKSTRIMHRRIDSVIS